MTRLRRVLSLAPAPVEHHPNARITGETTRQRLEERELIAGNDDEPAEGRLGGSGL